MRLTEKETLLKIIYCGKKYNCLCSYNYLKCSNCFYSKDNRCNYHIIYTTKQIPEEIYIKKFGYESLIEELL